MVCRWCIPGGEEALQKLNGVHALGEGDEGNMNQVLLAFILIHHTKKEYKKILKALRKVLLDMINVRKMVMDFEIGVWSAVQLQCCAFHWAQAILHKVQGPYSIQRCHLTSTGNPIVEMRWSYDRLIPTMGFPIPVRLHLYIESAPRISDSPCPTWNIAPHKTSCAKSWHWHFSQWPYTQDGQRPWVLCLALMSCVMSSWLDGNWSPQYWSVYSQAVCTNNDVKDTTTTSVATPLPIRYHPMSSSSCCTVSHGMSSEGQEVGVVPASNISPATKAPLTSRREIRLTSLNSCTHLLTYCYHIVILIPIPPYHSSGTSEFPDKEPRKPHPPLPPFPGVKKKSRLRTPAPASIHHLCWDLQISWLMIPHPHFQEVWWIHNKKSIPIYNYLLVISFWPNLATA